MPDHPPRYLPIDDYAIIGDCGSAALVSRHGSIDWLCWPRFDSPSVFGALLDAEKGGHFQIRPQEEYTVERRYAGDTNVLETTFTTKSGVLRLTDLMTVAAHEAYDTDLWADHELLRRVECLDGTVSVKVVCDPRPGYGRRSPHLNQRGRLGYFYMHRTQVLVLRSEIPMEHSKNRDGLTGRVTLQAGECRYVALSSDQQEPAVLPLLGEHAGEKIERTKKYWQGWTEQCQYDGPYRDAVVRSALTLKLMTYALSGAVLAAPTTSLPEHVGGQKNWDYRYCWIRDASFTLRALFELGYYQEGEAFFSWLLQATRTTLPHVSVLYTVFGGTPDRETHLDHLEGYKGSQPVRAGNEARAQIQLDIYGEVISAAFEYVNQGRELDRFQGRMLAKLGQAICDQWEEPDNGIWELRSPRRRHTHSLAMCWIGLHRLLQLHEDGYIDIPTDQFTEVGDQIRDTIEKRGYNDELGSYVATLDGRMMDASLLLLPIYGYIDPEDERMQKTWDCLLDQLEADNSLFYRYLDEDQSPPSEGAFDICSFWAVEYLARAGRTEEACRRFEDMLGYANDVGLFAEEIDPESGAALGNFPQAFSHVGLINAALHLAKAVN